MHKLFPYPLYLVISEADCIHHSFTTVLHEALQGGVDIVQLREKKLSTDAFLEKALMAKKITDSYGIPLIINDNLEVARLSNAFGIHVGNSDTPPAVIRQSWPECQCLGYSVETVGHLANESAAVSDYLGISPVFSTHTKQDTITEWGINGVRNIRSATTLPLIAIGNMHAGNAATVIKAGADSIAVVSAICGSKVPLQAARLLKSIITDALHHPKHTTHETI